MHIWERPLFRELLLYSITMVIEVFATDGKVYSTSLLPFSVTWFLAKSAICQFKIYSRIFSSCAYYHRDGYDLKT